MFVTLTGLFQDWLITRHWTRLCLFLAPLVLLAVLVLLSFIGSRIPRETLAQDYVEAGQANLDEIPDWAFTDDGQDDTSKTKVSRFTEALFQRAQQLRPSDPLTLFVIGGVLGQRGAKARALSIMRSLAPKNRKGFLPAHAWLATQLVRQPQRTPEENQLLKHHLDLGIKWEGAPANLLAAATQLALYEQKGAAALTLLSQSAAKDSRFEGDLFRLASELGNSGLAESTAAKAVPRIKLLIEEGIATYKDRIDLADIYFAQENYDEARQVLQDGIDSGAYTGRSEEKLVLALSEIYRRRFEQTLKISSGNWSADLRLLDRAMRIDPTNGKVAETVAQLARIGGKQPPDALMKQLARFLTEGTATPVTHAWIAEAHILRAEYPQAIQHLQSVLEREPNAPHSLNNLAYTIGLEFPNNPQQLEKALVMATKATMILPKMADFHDTRGYLLAQLDRNAEAIAALETAVENNPNRPDFHDRLKTLYEKTNNESMSLAHAKRAKQLRDAIAAQQK